MLYMCTCIRGRGGTPLRFCNSRGDAEMVVGVGAVLGILLLGLVVVCGGLLRWNELRYRKKGLPPGTMGWPVIGENSEFLKQGPTFLKNQRARYIIMNEGKGLVPGYPQSMLDMMGKWNIAAVHGPQHKAMRSAMLNLISPTAIRDQLLPKIDEFMRSFIRSWSDRVIDIQEESKEVGRFINSITLLLIILD
ncbi:hypothetical protein B296_00056482 [Ensete ventricosum]|uniref:Cytochrome P450 n=1 Tax=Ensete ventricosum TaxID=4639 RepID=A0A426WZD0_ENSVE|nr:hypothetical protein B296_00056482 [Ensete ventricosum]